MITFENRAVAFADVIGFKGLVKKAAQSVSELGELNQLVSLLSGVMPYLDGGVHKMVPTA